MTFIAGMITSAVLLAMAKLVKSLTEVRKCNKEIARDNASRNAALERAHRDGRMNRYKGHWNGNGWDWIYSDSNGTRCSCEVCKYQTQSEKGPPCQCSACALTRRNGS